jgi:hypothetical protein
LSKICLTCSLASLFIYSFFFLSSSSYAASFSLLAAISYMYFSCRILIFSAASRLAFISFSKSCSVFSSMGSGFFL